MGLTTFGVFHTVIGIMAVTCGIVALFQHREILARIGIGQAYILLTLVTAVTGLFIFRHGGFGPPHVLSLLTIVALAVGVVAGRTSALGGRSRIVQAVAFTTTLLFHAVPTVTESSIRLPVGDPLFRSPEDPGLRPIFGVLFGIYAIGLWLQMRWIRRKPAGIP